MYDYGNKKSSVYEVKDTGTKVKKKEVKITHYRQEKISTYDKLKKQHKKYVKAMREIDIHNKSLRIKISRMSSRSTQTKDKAFHEKKEDLSEKLRVGIINREECRSQVRRTKETIKNLNRHQNGIPMSELK